VDNTIFLLITGSKIVYKIDKSVFTYIMIVLICDLQISCNMDNIMMHDHLKKTHFHDEEIFYFIL
jgi:hypothetical protein